MKYFIDTEFIESGPHHPIELISIGIVAEDGREIHMISSEFNPDHVSDWVKENVLPNLGNSPFLSRKSIAENIQNLIGSDTPEFWGYYADYDWVVFCQLFGRMIDLPKGWPMFCYDLKQMAMELGNPRLPIQLSGTEHNALWDARWNKAAYEFLMDKASQMRLVGAGSGLGAIVDERLRQISDEGWTPEHDDTHTNYELSSAACCYAQMGNGGPFSNPHSDRPPSGWPWARGWWKPSADPMRNLVKAGALIAAEIDRLQRKTKGVKK